MRYFIIILYCIIPVCCVQAQPADTLYQPVQVRSFSHKAINDFKTSRQFQYENIKEPVMSWWDRFWTWVWWWIGELMKTPAGKNTVWGVVIVLGVAILSFAIYKIVKMNRAGLFMRPGGKPLGFTIGHEDIHQVNFDEAIATAIDQKNFRLAIRLHYLKVLKLLSDKQMIDWKLNKTNKDYLREVADKPWHTLFRQLTHHFEYTWYGQMNIAPAQFEKLRQDFIQLHNLV